MATPEVVVVGGAMFDYHYAVTNLPEPDGGSYAPEVDRAFGGVGANVAVALSRLGRDVGLLSRVGDDEDGEWIRNYLEETTIDTDRLQVGEEASTYSIVLRDPGGDRMVVTANRSFRGLEFDEEDLTYVADADAVFVTAYTPDRVVSSLFEAAAESSVPPVVFDLSGPVPEFRDRGTAPATIERGMEHCGLFVSGRVAAQSFFDGEVETASEFDDSLETATERLSRASVPRAALTCGTDGATLLAENTQVAVDAFDVPVVDTTGAGDTFAAALIDRWLLAGERTEEAGRFAAAAAALNCTSRFAQPGTPTREEVRSFLADR